MGAIRPCLCDVTRKGWDSRLRGNDRWGVCGSDEKREKPPHLAPALATGFRR